MVSKKCQKPFSEVLALLPFLSFGQSSLLQSEWGVNLLIYPQLCPVAPTVLSAAELNKINDNVAQF